MGNTVLSNVCSIHKIPLKDGVCPECQGTQRVERDQNSTGVRGKPLRNQDNVMHCPKCHVIVKSDTAKFCPNCGEKLPEAKEPEFDNDEPPIGKKLILNFDNNKTKELTLTLQTQPFLYSAKYKELEILVFPQNSAVFLLNPGKANVFLKIQAPYLLFNNTELRLGKLPFVFHYADLADIGVDFEKTVLVNQETMDDSEYAVDCIECVHPNFPKKIINLNKNEITLNRQQIVSRFEIEDEGILKRMGVSSKDIILKKLNNIWFVFPEDNPNVLLRIPPYSVPYLPEQEIFYGNVKFTVSLGL